MLHIFHQWFTVRCYFCNTY